MKRQFSSLQDDEMDGIMNDTNRFEYSPRRKQIKPAQIYETDKL